MGHCEKPIVKVEPFLDEPVDPTKVSDDTEVVDIVCLTNKGDFATNEYEDLDATDYSSSFADTTSDAENGSKLSDAEVESEFLGDNGLVDPFDGSSFPMRKRKLTDHWRNFIRPLMWRCKWTELRIREIDSQASKYSKELAEYDKGKHRAPDQFTLEEFGSKSLPFLGEQLRSKAIKRRKRKKVEDTTEIGSYTSHHYIFSYLEHKKSDHDGTLADDFGNPVITEPHADSTDRFGSGEDLPLLVFNETDASLEKLLWTIDSLHAKVQKLKSDVDGIMSKNASKFSSSENLSLLLPHGSSAQSPTTSAGNGDTASVGIIYNSIHHEDDFDIGDFVMDDSAISSYGGVPMIPDIIESTVGLLSAADVTFHSSFVGDSCEDIMVDNLLIHEVAETDEHTFISASHHLVDESSNPVPIPMSDTNTAANPAVSQDQSSVQSNVYRDSNVPKNKRKRGERKACSGGWSKKCSGDSENL